MRILFLINNGFEETETLAPYDIFKRAGYDVILSSKCNSAIGAHGLHITNLELYNTIDYKSFDCLILPGGPQYKENMKDEKYLEIMSYFAKEKIIGAICASPTIIAENVFLKGLKYTCFPPMKLGDEAGVFTGEKVEISKNIITSRSAGTSLEFGYAVVESLEGKEKVLELQKSMYYIY